MVNSEGYRDSTADVAVHNADKEARKRSKSLMIIRVLQFVAQSHGCALEGTVHLIWHDGTHTKVVIREDRSD